MIDFHCHIDLYPNPKDIAVECHKRGLYVLSVTTTPSAWKGTSLLATGSERIRTALGLHPQLAQERYAELGLFDELLPQTRYVGEIGLDGSPECRCHWREQLAVFEHILESCQRAGGRIVSIHSRHASQPVLEILRARRDAGTPILHWFSGSLADLEQAVEQGCWFSIGPAMIRSKRGLSLCARMPKNRVLTETDGPFVQINRTACMPWDVTKVVVGLSQLWNVPLEEAEETLNTNCRVLLEQGG